MVPALARAAVRPQKEVLAFYYGWYANPAPAGGDGHWANVLDTPAGGPYSSLDPATISGQVDTAKAAGITGLIASWWGQSDITNQQLTPLLTAAEAKGIKVCAYLEQATTPEALAADIVYIYHTHAQSSAWLKLNGKPAIFVFDRVLQTLNLDGWQKARALVEAQLPKALAFVGTANNPTETAARRSAFDALHIYSVQFDLSHKRMFNALWRLMYYWNWVGAQKGMAVTTATLMPGYDDHLLPDRTGTRPIVDRMDGNTLRALGDAARAAHPDWLLVVSFNEWLEASQIEPSKEFGDRELTTLKTISAKFLQRG